CYHAPTRACATRCRATWAGQLSPRTLWARAHGNLGRVGAKGAAQAALAKAAVRRTFEKYWEFFTQRRDSKARWEAFTPYEMRVIGAFVRLGWRERASEALAWFLTQRRPPAWAQWPRRVRPDPPPPAVR